MPFISICDCADSAACDILFFIVTLAAHCTDEHDVNTCAAGSKKILQENALFTQHREKRANKFDSGIPHALIRGE